MTAQEILSSLLPTMWETSQTVSEARTAVIFADVQTNHSDSVLCFYHRRHLHVCLHITYEMLVLLLRLDLVQ